MARKRTSAFNPQTFLTKVGNGKTSLTSPKKQIIYSQGDAAEAVFYIQAGKVKLTVVAKKPSLRFWNLVPFLGNPAL
jgi:CRP/FNR family cyclic AMP-dependent transcriptional regulator